VHIEEILTPFSDDKCYGFSGRTGSMFQMSGECGGTNYGNIFYAGPHGWINDPYRPGAGFRTSLRSIYQVSISMWKGSDSCPNF
jgi:hypothetical protein